MIEIKVECYAGCRSEERPVRFVLGDCILEIREIEDRWYSPSARHFRIQASDGNIYVLRHDEDMDCWTLDAYRKGI